MALNFTDDQVKTITNDIISLPTVISSLQNDKAQIQAQEASLEDTDEQNKVFTDNFIGILQQYFLEKSEINGVVHTIYSESLIQGAPSRSNDHFETDPIWKNFPPQALPSNNGNPTSNNANYEIAQIPVVEDKIDQLKNGYADGALDDTASTAPSGGQVEVDAGGFSVGQSIVIDDSNNDLFATIDAVDGTPTVGAELIEYTIIAGSETGLGIGARVRNFHPGFSDDERENVVTPDAPATMAYFKSLIDPEVDVWEGFLTDQETALQANDAQGSEATEISDALTDVQTAISVITTWESAPAGGDGVGKYGDTALAPLEGSLVTRASQAPARVTEIDSAIGNLSQNPADGSFSGAGNFKRLFDFIDLRINLAAGSLQKLFRVTQSIVFFDQQINGAQTQLTEYENIFLVKQFSVDGNGSEFVQLADVTGLSVGNSVKLMDNDSIVFDRTIVDIQGNTVELDSALGVNLLVDKLARLAKEL